MSRRSFPQNGPVTPPASSTTRTPARGRLALATKHHPAENRPAVEISHLPSQDLFIVERPDGSEVMIPFVEEIVTEIDLEEQRAVIDPPPGLIDDRAEIASSRDEA